MPSERLILFPAPLFIEPTPTPTHFDELNFEGMNFSIAFMILFLKLSSACENISSSKTLFPSLFLNISKI